MSKHNIIIASALSSLLLATQAEALEVDREVMPRITLGGRVITTADAVDLDSDTTEKSHINLEDSTLLTRFDKRMYEDGVAGAVVGFKENEGNVGFHQLNAFYWNRDLAVRMGRSNLRNSLIEFPTLRDDDLLTYTHVGNASSNTEFDQIYGKQLSFDWFIDDSNKRLGIWTGSRRDETGVTSVDGFDSVGAGYTYEVAEDLQYISRIRHAGLLLDRQKVNTSTEEKWMNAFIAGAEFNLNINPKSSWSMGVQAIANQGTDTVSAADILYSNADAVSNRAMAESRSLVASVRYTARPQLLTRWQAGMTVAGKDYSDFSNASQWSIAPSLVYRIGQGVDLLAQARYTSYDQGLGDGSDTVVQLGIVFTLESIFNDTLGERDTILNIEHGYIK